MQRLLTLLTSTIFAGSLTVIGISNAHAGISIQFSAENSRGVHAGHQRHTGHDVHRGHRSHQSNIRHHSAARPYRSRHRTYRNDCRPVFVRSHDHHGREILRDAIVCYDEFGRSFLVDD